jgi:hypothetical protein
VELTPFGSSAGSAAPPAAARARAIQLSVGLGALFLASRAPLLAGGFGSDDDAWRNAVAALHSHLAGRYVPSRVPGFPVYEGLLFLLVPLGSLATNALSVLAQGTATCFLWRIGRRLDLPASGWIAAAFALAPSVWVQTSQTVDYALTLALVLAAYDQLLGARWKTAGILLALAAGSRATTGLLIAPALLFAWQSTRSWRALFALSAGFTLVAVAVFLPALLAPETGGLQGHLLKHVSRHHLRAEAAPGVARGSLVFLFGKAGALGLIASVVAGTVAGSGRCRRPAPRRGRPALIFEAPAVLIVAAAFALIPYDPAYLLPALPLLLLMMGRLAQRHVLALAALLMASEAFVVPLLGTRRLVPGRLPVELAVRARNRDESLRLLRPPAGPPGILVVGRFGILRLLVLAPELERTDAAWAPFDGPGVALWRAGRRIGYAATLTARQRDSLTAAGYRIVESVGPAR